MARKEQSKEVRDAYKKGKTAYNMAYTKANCDRIELRLHKGTKARWKALADAEGISLTEFIVRKVDGGAETAIPNLTDAGNYWINAYTKEGERLFTYESAPTIEKCLKQLEIWEGINGYEYSIREAWIEFDGRILHCKKTENGWSI